MQFTVSAIPEFSYCQFRKVHHFLVSHALHNKQHVILEKLTVLSMTQLIICSIAEHPRVWYCREWSVSITKIQKHLVIVFLTKMPCN